MRNGKVAARPPGLREALKARMEHKEKVGNLMTRLKGLPGAQAPFSPFGQAQSNLVKLGQAWSSLVKLGQAWSNPVKAKTGV